MGVRIAPNDTCRTTDHSEDITAMEKFVLESMVEDHPEYGMFLETLIVKAAAALLTCHDATGISLDNWTGPRELVEQALTIIGKGDEDFVENGV